MKISNAAIDRPRVVLVITAMVIFAAIFAVMNIAVQRTPGITKAVVIVAVPYPGANPTEVEEQIVRKIEEALQTLDKVDFIASTSMRGSGVIQVIFLDGVDPTQARDDVKHKVDQITSQLPRVREVQPVITRIDFENAPIMLVNITAPEGFDEGALKQIAEDAKEEIDRVAGVANTQLFGGREREIHVDINPYLTAEYGLTLGDVRRAITQSHAETPGGSQNTGKFDAQVVSATKFRDLADIREVVVSRGGGRRLQLQDIARISDTYRRRKSLAQLDGRSSATIIVNKDPNINTLGAAKAVKAQVAKLQQQFPHVRFSTTRDTTEEISVMFRVLGSSALFGAMLVLIILVWSMGFRVSIMVLMAIPFSTAVALVFLFAAGIPISNMVIFSFILVLGMVVDGAIIVAENIHRHIERGEDPVTAAKTGIEEVGRPVIAADLTTVAAFVPMLLMPGIMGDFMGVMPKVVSVALLGSVLVDHFLIPVVASLWYRKRQLNTSASAQDAAQTSGEKQGDEAPPLSKTRPNLGIFTRSYLAVLRYSLDHRWVVVSCCALAIVWAFLIYGKVDHTFFPPSDRGQFEVKFELPLGYSIEETIAAARSITDPLEEMKQEYGEIVHFVSAIGSSGGLSSRLENDPATGPEFGTVMVQLYSPLDRPIHKRLGVVRHEDEIIKELRGRIKAIPGVKITFERVQEGPPGGSKVAVRLTGKELERLGDLSQRITERLKSVKGTIDVVSDYRPHSPEIRINPRADVVGHYDMTEAQVATAIQTAVLGDSTIELSLEEEDVTLRIQVDPDMMQNIDDIGRLMLTSPNGRRATIGQLAELQHSVGLYGVNHYDRRRAVMARCDLIGKTTPDAVFAVLRADILPELGFQPMDPPEGSSIVNWFKTRVMKLIGREPSKADAVTFLGKPNTPAEGVRATFTGENEERDKNFGYLLNCMIIAVLGIFAILVMQFNSFRQTMVVLVTVPLSFIGVMAGMWMCGFPFSLATYIGLVSLTGIVVNDAIVLVDFTNRARRRGMSVRDALLESGANRLRPVILTTVTTIGGLLPLLLNLSGGAEFWQPLTGAVVFGLACATVLTLVVIPVAYSVAYNRTFLAAGE